MPTMLELMLEEHIKYCLAGTRVNQCIIQFYSVTSMYYSEFKGLKTQDHDVFTAK